MSFPSEQVHNKVQEYSLTLQKELLQQQIEIEKLQHETELEALQKKLQGLQNQRLTLNTLLRQRDQLQDTNVPSQRDLTQSCQSFSSFSSYMTQSNHNTTGPFQTPKREDTNKQ